MEPFAQRGEREQAAPTRIRCTSEADALSGKISKEPSVVAFDYDTHSMQHLGMLPCPSNDRC